MFRDYYHGLLGYLALDQQTSNLFYQVISTRHSQKRAIVITTNTAFSEWGNILYNTTIATAIVDRLVENSEIFLLRRRQPPQGQEPFHTAGRVASAASIMRRAVAISRMEES